jgi:hypothetical protein
MPIELWIHGANELLKSQQLFLHSALIAKEVLLLKKFEHIIDIAVNNE